MSSQKTKARSRKLALIPLIIMLAVLASFSFGYVYAQITLSFSTIIENGTMVEPYAYIIFEDPIGLGADGSTYYARNGLTGAIDYNNTDFSTILQVVINVVPEGSSILIKVGVYDFYTTVTVDERLYLNGEDRFGTLLRARADNLLMFNVTSEDVYFQNLGFRQYSGFVNTVGIRALNNVFVFVYDCSFLNFNGASSIMIDFGSMVECRIERNRFWSSDGIAIQVRTVASLGDSTTIYIRGNYFNGIGTYGIYFTEGGIGSVISENVFEGNLGSAGVRLLGPRINFIENLFDSPSTGSVEFYCSGGACCVQRNIFATTNKVFISGGNNYVQDNTNFVARTRGSQTVANGETVTHYLAGTPTEVLVTARTLVYYGNVTVVGVTSRGSSTFTVGVYWANGTAITDDAIVIDYYAEYNP